MKLIVIPTTAGSELFEVTSNAVIYVDEIFF